MNYHKALATSWLILLRDGTYKYERYTGYLREKLHNGKLSLVNIGTSEEELEELRVKGCGTSTTSWLCWLREGVSD